MTPRRTAMSSGLFSSNTEKLTPNGELGNQMIPQTWRCEVFYLFYQKHDSIDRTLCWDNYVLFLSESYKHGCVMWWVRLWVLHACVSYHSWRVAVVYLEAGHGFNNGHNGLDGITINHCSVLFTLIFWIAIFMDDPENMQQECRTFLIINLNVNDNVL